MKITSDIMVSVLKGIESHDEIPQREWLSDDDKDDYKPHDLVKQTMEIAHEYFTLTDGDDHHIHRGRVDEFNRWSGFKVSRGEYDEFGWETGVLHTKKGKILFDVTLM